LPTLLLAALLASPAAAWTPACQQSIAEEAARLAPPDLAALLARHAKELDAGATDPFQDRDPTLHFQNEDGSGRLAKTFADEVAQTVAALRSFRPFSEISFRLGRVSHWIADLNNPLNASASDRAEGRYFKDYLLYVDSARPRFALVVYENQPALTAKVDVGRLAADALARGRELYPLLGREYRRVGFHPGLGAFDDRSTAFGVAALSYSHAVTDVARVLRYIWLQGGGGDPRTVLDRPRDRLLVVERTSP